MKNTKEKKRGKKTRKKPNKMAIFFIAGIGAFIFAVKKEKH
jgi:hypothetical protein